MRESLLDRLKPQDALNNKTVLAELMALRTIVINLAIARARGQPMSQVKSVKRISGLKSQEPAILNNKW